MPLKWRFKSHSNPTPILFKSHQIPYSNPIQIPHTNPSQINHCDAAMAPIRMSKLHWRPLRCCDDMSIQTTPAVYRSGQNAQQTTDDRTVCFCVAAFNCKRLTKKHYERFTTYTLTSNTKKKSKKDFAKNFSLKKMLAPNSEFWGA